MLTGRDTLSHLNRTVQSAREELERLDRELQTTTDAANDNRAQRSQALRQLAAMRLDALREGEIISRLDAADGEVARLLEQQQQALTELQQRVAASRGTLDDLEAQRERQHEVVDDAARLLAEREAAVQQALQSDEAFQQQLARSREAESIAVSAAEKAELAEADRREKGQAFETNELFMYLWRRGYGTSTYEAGRLSRMLDAWVARLCGFDAARPNYWMLLEIPTRLQEHADNARADADQELDRLQDLEEAAAAAGGVTKARDALLAAEQRQDDIDLQIARSETSLHDLMAEQGRFTTGGDSYTAQCLAVFANAFHGRDVEGLTRLARATMTIEDDAMVDEVRRLREDAQTLDQELQHNRELQREHLQRVQELEQVRRQFKRNRYDDLRSGFDNKELILRLIAEVLGGAIRGGALWDVLRRYQRYRDVAGAWPDFGSGGLGRPGRRGGPRRPTWHSPGGGPAGGGFRLPRPGGGPGGGRGGFRTGGGF
ncbi:MAG: hypothetical protein KJO38_02050 [Gammaproteobacteria bacterium]|nr:hypothetical protein [Gammaproteobacteria bacterium]